jgi:hypothetical protein
MNDLPATRPLARPTPLPRAGRRSIYYRFTETRPAPPRLAPMAQPVGHSPKDMSVSPTRFFDDLPSERLGARP